MLPVRIKMSLTVFLFQNITIYSNRETTTSPEEKDEETTIPLTQNNGEERRNQR